MFCGEQGKYHFTLFHFLCRLRCQTPSRHDPAASMDTMLCNGASVIRARWQDVACHQLGDLKFFKLNAYAPDIAFMDCNDISARALKLSGAAIGMTFVC